MPAQTVHEEIEDALGPDWRERARLDGRDAPGGRLHRPGAPRPLAATAARWRSRSSTPAPARRCWATCARSPGWPGHGPRVPRHRHRARWSRSSRRARPRSSTTASRREAQQAFADAFARATPRSSCPTSCTSARPCWSPSGWISTGIPGAGSSPTARRQERDHYGELLVRFTLRRPRAHRDAARRPAPRQLPHPSPTPTGHPGGSACSTTAPSPGCPSGTLPAGDGTADAAGDRRGPRRPAGGPAREGFVKDNIRVDPQVLLDYLAPLRGAAAAWSGSASPASGCASQFERRQRHQRSRRYTRDRPRSTCRRRTSSSTAPGSAASGC